MMLLSRACQKTPPKTIFHPLVKFPVIRYNDKLEYYPIFGDNDL